MNRPRIIVEIDELVLHGFDPRERMRIGEAVQAEMQALLAGSNASSVVSRQVDRLDAGQFRTDGQGGKRVGQLAARSLHRSLF